MIGLDALIAAGLKILDKVIPDPAAKAEAQYRLLQLRQSEELAALQAELSLSLAQSEVNKVEASSEDPFVRRWRPAVGWVCVFGLVYQFLGWPLLSWASPMIHVPTPPELDLGDLITLLAGMLGLSAMRTKEKLNGVA